jgi:hypothetical protein
MRDLLASGNFIRHHHWRWASATPISMAGPPGPRQPIQLPLMNQGPLTTADWALWRQALTKCFCSRGQSLRQPLGKWTRPPTSTRRWYFDPATERLLEQHNGTVKVYSRKAGQPSRRAQLKFDSSISSTATDITPTAVPAKVYRQGSLLVVTG